MKFIEVNGTTIHYKFLQNGRLSVGGGRTFVFINSLGTDFRIWDGVVDLLKDFGDILLFDKRGHGLSDVAENTNGLNDFTEDVLALLRYLLIDKCIPVGLSVGGMIAQLLALRKPELVEKLVLCDTSYKIGNASIWNERITLVKEKGLPAISDGVMQRWFSEKFRNEMPAAVSGYRNMLERASVLGYIKTSEAIRDTDLTEIAGQIRIPALCVVGSEDKSTLPEEVKSLADLVEGSVFKIIEGSGHIPCVDNPGVLSKMIIDFIK